MKIKEVERGERLTKENCRVKGMETKRCAVGCHGWVNTELGIRN